MNEKELVRRITELERMIEDLRRDIHRLDMENISIKKEIKINRRDINNNSRRGR